MKKGVIILGVNSIGRIALDVFNANRVLVYGFLDENKALHNELVHDVPVLGNWEHTDYLNMIKNNDCEAFIATDEQVVRKHLFKLLKKQCKKEPISALHPSAWVSPYASLGSGVLLAAQAVVHANATIGKCCNIHPHTLIDTFAKINDFAHIGVGSSVGAEVKVGEGAFIGAGVTLVAGVEIGKNARIGAGSVVISSVKEGETVWGNPAKKV